MTEHTGANIIWHPETITPGMAETLRTLRDRGLIDHAYLAGGTALALRFGHRLSVDLDFFAPDLFEVAKAPHTIHAVTQRTKVSFLGYPYPELFPPAQFEGVPVADPRDIACMKLSAIASRGTKRDFIDLYVASAQFGLQEILAWFARKYAKTRYSRLHLLKSLTYFGDAEKDPLPHMLVPLAWEDVLYFFKKEVPPLL
ncbi:MAG: nucleotidyl transferase AbiEii/AbiGii toxin family protein [Bryobacterales bacterium]|nr:nucleotidyl transferase AbiEii/AbiGii toxin family protein [Bryobacterales bacterium]